MALEDALRQLDLAIRQAAQREREAAARLRQAEARLAETERRLSAVEAYAREYRGRQCGDAPRRAGALQDEQRFLLELERTVMLQNRITEQERAQLDQARLGWATARQRRQAIEDLRDARADRARRKREAAEQQRLDDGYRPARGVRHLGGG